MSERSSGDGDGVECARGHWNSPYPEDGKCRVCHTYLPGNKDRLTSETAAVLNKRSYLSGRTKKERLQLMIEQAGYTMSTVPEVILMYAETAIQTGAASDLDKFAQQVEQLKPAPRARQDDDTPEEPPTVVINGDALKETLDYYLKRFE